MSIIIEDKAAGALICPMKVGNIDNGTSYCVGSSCMAWVVYMEAKLPLPTGVSITGRNPLKPPKLIATSRGSCGMAR